uniref:Putative secreted protein ovary overexpressed n=1 Tax=Rhipicephalus microplus TaxID=6941 RepID=A0A6M2DBT8_RHIMP
MYAHALILVIHVNIGKALNELLVETLLDSVFFMFSCNVVWFSGPDKSFNICLCFHRGKALSAQRSRSSLHFMTLGTML